MNIGTAGPAGEASPTGRARVGMHRFSTAQKGIALIIALIVLVALTLAGIALVRSVNTGNLIAGNLAFKEGATLAGDMGTEEAINWLKTRVNTPSAYIDQPTAGYYATSQDTLDVTGSSGDPDRALVDWDANNCNDMTTSACITPSAAVSDSVGNSISYVIHRLCQSTGDPNATSNSCANYQALSSTSPKRGEIKYGDDKRFEPLPTEYYRIISRVKGPRNTISFVETVIHF